MNTEKGDSHMTEETNDAVRQAQRSALRWKIVSACLGVACVVAVVLLWPRNNTPVAPPGPTVERTEDGRIRFKAPETEVVSNHPVPPNYKPPTVEDRIEAMRKAGQLTPALERRLRDMDAEDQKIREQLGTNKVKKQ
jgi:hypothetical protein